MNSTAAALATDTAINPALHKAAICGANCGHLPVSASPAQASAGNQIQQFFAHLFSVADWPARWYCGTWSEFHGWLYIVSDVLIWGLLFRHPGIAYCNVTPQA
jgi:chemotaxis family two-component system sensor kinase Cph1